ncbi:MAG TPA: DUF6191 domain-containing protein [Amycolatopsis sp.]|nr:DUF6191 domain-containing protein [Amycolatopsis sp.]
MASVFQWSIPLSVLLMVGVGVFETLRHRHRKRSGTPLTATYINEFTAMFYGTKGMELDHRDSMSMLRDDDAQGAPPRTGIDLDSGVAYLRRHGRGTRG